MEQTELTQAATLGALMLRLDRPIELPALGITYSLTDASMLRQLHGLTQLDLGAGALSNELLAELSTLGLRSLAVRLPRGERLGALLEACPRLEHLTLRHFTTRLEPVAGLERLRSLVLMDHRIPISDPPKLADGLALPQLESLFVAGPDRRDIERIAALGLRRLTVLDPVGDPKEIVAALAQFTTLEHLGLLWRRQAADITPLSGLSRLRSLALGDNMRGELHAPTTLERLVFQFSGVSVRVHGVVPTLHCGFRSWNNMREQIAELAQTKTLGGVGWDLSKPIRPAEHLTSVETLVLDGASVAPELIAWLTEFPQLRTVIWPNLTIRQQQAANELLPHLQILGADTARLRQDWPRPTDFDLLAPSNWPKCE